MLYPQLQQEYDLLCRMGNDQVCNTYFMESALIGDWPGRRRGVRETWREVSLKSLIRCGKLMMMIIMRRGRKQIFIMMVIIESVMMQLLLMILMRKTMMVRCVCLEQETSTEEGAASVTEVSG